MKPRASIVVTTFNRADLLPDAIDSSLAQTLACEIIVVDHGSTDSTPAAVAAYGDRVRYIRRELDSGPEFSWLDGVLVASTEFVKILHDDDWLEPTFMEQTCALLHDDVGFVFSAAWVKGTEKELLNTLYDKILPKSGVYSSRGDRRKIAEAMISPTALVMRKSDLVDGIYSGKLPFQTAGYHGAGADHYLKLLAMLRYQKFGYINHPLANFRAHPGSITTDAATQDTKKKELQRVYGDVLDLYVFLHISHKLRLLSVARLINSSHVRYKAAISFWIRYGRQIRSKGPVPLRLRRKNQNFSVS